MSNGSNDNADIREIRIDPIVPTESVLISTARGQRPKKKEELAPRNDQDHVETCPFCRGNELMTPPAITTIPNDKNWQIRIVENLYPVLSDASGDAPGGTSDSGGLRQTIDGYGRHEVIIDHHRHGVSLYQMSTEHLAALFGVYRQRMRQLYDSDDRLRYVLVFKNFGPAAGASIPHTHSQIIAMPVVPENVQAEVQFSQAWYRTNHRCVYCALIDDAMAFSATVFDREAGESQRKLVANDYVVEKGKHFVAIKPFASRYEWEVHILPVQHEPDFLQITAEQLVDLARVMRRTMARLESVLGGAQFNYFLHSLPHNTRQQDCDNSYHWHIEICPRTSIPTGFELGSGLFVNTISPEDAASQLRNVQLDVSG